MKIIIIFNVVKLSSVGAEKVLILLDILRFLIWIFEWNLIEYFLIKIDFLSEFEKMLNFQGALRFLERNLEIFSDMKIVKS